MKEGIKNKKAQIWIETVIYLLIAFVMIGLVLSFVKPKVEEIRDEAIIEQSLEVMRDIENLVLTIGSPGNKRLMEIEIRKGNLNFDCENDKVIFEIESKYVYTEPGEEVEIGNIIALTEDKGEYNLVTLERDFSDDYDITYKKEDISKTLTKASTPYKLYLINEGEVSNKIVMNIDLE